MCLPAYSMFENHEVETEWPGEYFDMGTLTVDVFPKVSASKHSMCCRALYMTLSCRKIMHIQIRNTYMQ